MTDSNLPATAASTPEPSVPNSANPAGCAGPAGSSGVGIAAATTIDRNAMRQPTPDVAGGRLIAEDGRTMPFRGCSVEVDAAAGLARVLLRQTFVNDGDEPLRARYRMPLPHDAAVGGYSFTIGGQRIVGEIRSRETARAQFESALIEGRTAGLLEQERSSVFTQELGNIPPKAEVECELVLDQPLRWLEDGGWEWRFPTVIAPRYLGAVGRVADAERVTVDVAAAGTEARATLQMRLRDLVLGAPESAVSSPSHGLSVASSDGEHAILVSLAEDDGARLDRDVVVQWKVPSSTVGLALDRARANTSSALSDSAHGVLTITPPAPTHRGAVVPRDLTLLLDTSGSMSGRPLELMKRLAVGVVESLKESDTIEMIEYSMVPRRWRRSAALATSELKQDAIGWINERVAAGGTEMQSGVREALKPSGSGRQRQVLLFTDGLISFEREVIGIARQAASAGCRLHVVGVGSATNRSLTAGVARAGGGTEFIVDLERDCNDTPARGSEGDLDQALRRLLLRISEPLAVNVRISGSAVEEVPASIVGDLLGGAPALVPLRLRPEGGEIVVEASTAEGPWRQTLDVPSTLTGAGNEGILRRFGRELVEELELRCAGDDLLTFAIEWRRLCSEIERVGLAYRISTRMTSWIAVSDEPTVDPRDPTQRVEIPQEMAYGLDAEALGLRPCPPRMHLRYGTAPGYAAPQPGSIVAGARYVAPRGAERPEIAAVTQWLQLDQLTTPVRMVTRIRPPRDERSEGQPQNPPDDQGGSRLEAFIVALVGPRLVLEFTLAGPLHWDPERIELPGIEELRIDRSVTTRSGDYPPGLVIRLVIDCFGGAEGGRLSEWFKVEPRRITVHMADASSVTLTIRCPT